MGCTPHAPAAPGPASPISCAWLPRAGSPSTNNPPPSAWAMAPSIPPKTPCPPGNLVPLGPGCLPRSTKWTSFAVRVAARRRRSRRDRGTPAGSQDPPASHQDGRRSSGPRSRFPELNFLARFPLRPVSTPSGSQLGIPLNPRPPQHFVGPPRRELSLAFGSGPQTVSAHGAPARKPGLRSWIEDAVVVPTGHLKARRESAGWWLKSSRSRSLSETRSASVGARETRRL